jgi:hypothetical protein
MVLIDADNDWYLTNSSKLTYALLWFPKKISGVYYHETCRFRLLKMRQNSPTNICDFEKFPRGLYPWTLVKRGRRNGEGNEEEDEKGREGKRWGGRGTGMGRERKEGRREETGTTSFRTLPPPLPIARM